jgi:peptidoglycan/xylan/chitin deacetylase (PgdA/CDA1 family)
VFYVLSQPLLTVSQRLGIKMRTPLNILYYHDVPQVSRSSFARQMDALRHHARVVDADWRGKPDGRRLCAITFDDAFVSVIANALPELTKRDLPCTIFAPVGNLGRTPGWSMESTADTGDLVIDRQVLESLPSKLVKIGSHTVSHPHLSRIPREAARQEIEQSRFMLSSITGQNVSLIAFPYGDHDPEIVMMCRQAGYDLAFGIQPNPVDLAGGSYVRGRVMVNPSDGRLEFFLKMSGAYRWVPAASELKRAIRSPLRFLGSNRHPSVAAPSSLESRDQTPRLMRANHGS